MKKVFLYLFIFFLIILGIYFYRDFSQKSSQTPQPSETVSKKSPYIISQEKLPEETSQEKPSKQEPEIPQEYDLKVPFVPQAPFGVWDDLHNNACEEASVLLVHYFKQNKSLSKEQADKEIKAMVDSQIKKYGKHKDLTAQETADLAKEFYGYKNIKVIYDFTWDDVKKEIAQGNPVIVPAAGRLLKNPNFRRPGPIYHMFVIRGYTKDEIITNDVGTRNGERYRYSYTILNNALHDWTGNPDTIQTGKRAMLVID